MSHSAHVYKRPASGELKPFEARLPQAHWRNKHDEADAAKLGMWLFLATEILLFAGFFCAYAFMRFNYPGNWRAASHYYLNWEIGFANTCVLLLSSWTIVMAIRGAQLGRRWQVMLNLAITQICAAFFLVVKLGWEYWPKWQKGELPGGYFHYAGALGHAGHGTDAQALLAGAVTEQAAYAGAHIDHATYIPMAHDHLFMSIYWIATATHGVHVLVGMIVIAWAMVKAWKWHYGPTHITSLENVGLYWHIVDIIWIFLFPLLYLV